MDNKIKIIAIIGALGVGLGAFGAHGLKPMLDMTQMETYRTATLYHFVHVVSMLVLVFYQKDSKVANLSFYLFLAGIVCFSGSLYILSTKHLYANDLLNFLGPITPLGGLFFILAWINLWRLNAK